MLPLSFEFFPPKTTEQRETLEQTVQRLRPLRPEYVSCTFGAGGSTLSYTYDTVAGLQQANGLEVAPHLSCMGGTREEVRELLQRYVDLGCRRIVALRGDLPSGMATTGEFRHAIDLVRFIREEFDGHFHIHVAGYPEFHPQARSAESDLRHLAAKVAAGADGVITQYFFNPDAYARFVDDARRLGIAVPIVPGIMPISQFSQLKRFSDTCGAEIPRWIEQRMLGHGDDVEAIREFGADVVGALCRRLVELGAPALHFYTLNRARATLAVIERLQG
ncbi:MAG: methylenetetrahydrofolate reductase [NAD(P)H] [Xanthomonadales bacterium]|nr:5,10-methylenetetrahydrofolate reductase [Xanthomonadales bacterium]MCC6592361.1 methylenetetrahydrofolate reductase [NAD(P)H] [Xanthomonadales bacterium]MCE7932219.1 methylenetetrahydrofolate reductase [NAD(P)H] [Xanthomonadales bacterium PRO6]